MTEATDQQFKDKKSKRHVGRWVALGVLALAVAGVALLHGRVHGQGQGDGERASGSGAPGSPPGSSSGSSRRGGGGAGDRPVPVMVARATARDVPITLEGLGSVTAYKTVNVHTLVEGRLMRVVFREGQAVRAGELLAEVDPRPFTIQLHQAEAATARDEAQLHGAERNLERYAAVSAERLIPQQQTDDQRTLVEQLRATVQNDHAQIENAKLQLNYARITSPIDGITGVRQVDPGNLVHVADATGIVVVTQMDPIAVLFTLPQDDLPRVLKQQSKAPLTVQALPRDGDQPLATGKLALIDNQINQATATMRLKAVFPNKDRALWPNQFVRVRLLIDVRKDALVVPAVAVQRGPEGTFVYLAAENEHAVQRPVTVDVIEGTDAVVSRGLAPGDRVVIEGQAQLRPDARIALRERVPGGGEPGTSGAEAAAGRTGGSRRGTRRPTAETTP